MKYRGHVKNGVILLENGRKLENGTIVDVEPVTSSAAQPASGSREAVLQHAGMWATEAAEVDRLLTELAQTKQAEVNRQQESAIADDHL